MTEDVNIRISARDGTKSAFASASKSMDRMREDLKGTTRDLFSLKNVLTAVGIGSIADFLKSNIEAADRLQKLNEITGVSVEMLSRYGQVAELGGVATEDMMNGILKLSKNMQDSLITTTSASAIAFRQLGVNVLDSHGKLKNVNVALQEIANRFAHMKDGTQKTAIAISIFGRAGAQLIPTFNSLNEEIKHTSATIDTNFANAAANFNDELSRMKHAMQGAFATGKTGTALLHGLLSGMKGVEHVVITLSSGFAELGTIIGGVAASVAAAAEGDFRRAHDAFKMMNADIDQMEKERLKKIANLDRPDATKAQKAIGSFTPGNAASLSTSSTISKLKAQTDAVISSLNTQEEAIRASYDRRKKILDEALKDGIISQKKYGDLMARLEEDKNKKLSALSNKGVLDQLKHTQAGALYEAAIKAKQSVIDAYQWGASWGGPPAGILMAGIAGAYQAKQLADLGGSMIGGNGGSGGGGSVSPSSPPAIASSGSGSSTPAARTEHHLTIHGLPGGNRMADLTYEEIRELMRRQAEVTGGQVSFAP